MNGASVKTIFKNKGVNCSRQRISNCLKVVSTGCLLRFSRKIAFNLSNDKKNEKNSILKFSRHLEKKNTDNGVLDIH